MKKEGLIKVVSAISDICLQEDSIAQWYSNVFRVAFNDSKIFIEELLIKEISNAKGEDQKESMRKVAVKTIP